MLKAKIFSTTTMNAHSLNRPQNKPISLNIVTTKHPNSLNPLLVQT